MSQEPQPLRRIALVRRVRQQEAVVEHLASRHRAARIAILRRLSVRLDVEGRIPFADPAVEVERRDQSIILAVCGLEVGRQLVAVVGDEFQIIEPSAAVAFDMTRRDKQRRFRIRLGRVRLFQQMPTRLIGGDADEVMHSEPFAVVKIVELDDGSRVLVSLELRPAFERVPLRTIDRHAVGEHHRASSFGDDLQRSFAGVATFNEFAARVRSFVEPRRPTRRQQFQGRCFERRVVDQVDSGTGRRDVGLRWRLIRRRAVGVGGRESESTHVGTLPHGLVTQRD